jgi:hypothetical protein
MATPQGPESVVPPIIWAHADEALTLEDEAARMSAGALRNQLLDLLHRFTLRWVREFGSLHTKASGPRFQTLMDDLAGELARVSVDPTQALLDYAHRGQRLGVEQGFREAGVEPFELTVRMDFGTHAYVSGIAAAARDKLNKARGLASTLTGGTFNQTVLTSVTPANQAANVIDAAARRITNERLNAGISAVTTELGGTELWVAERDACVHCLAQSGHLIGADGFFDADRTFGAKPLSWVPDGGLTGPPRHNNCRCRLTPWFGHDTAGAESITHDWAGAIAEAQANGDVVAEQAAHQAAAAARQSAAFDLPAALRREAERSVLKGWALPSEPDLVRTKAADQLLAQLASHAGFAPSGWKVPQSVRKQAENRLKKGTFGVTPFPGK